VRITYQEAVEHGCVVPIAVHWRNVLSKANPVAGLKTIAAKNRQGIWRHAYRNRLIAEDARQFPPDEQVLIAVDTIEHAVHLKRLLPEFTLCYSENGLSEWDKQNYVLQGFLRDDEPTMTRKRRYELKRRFEAGTLKKVIANSVWKRGVDFRQLAVLIRADAGSSAIAGTQIPGRTSRICAVTNKSSSVVIDYRDQFDDGFARKAKKREKTYARHGWQQLFEGELKQKELF
jgi:superfamily II DNA or RNA helicase